MKPKTNNPRIIETDEFPFDFISGLAARESWRKEVHRPIYHIHKWWATRLGSVFRGILLGSVLSAEHDLAGEFYKIHDLPRVAVFDPFMGSGTTVGEAHKLGMTALGRDINPVAVEAVRTALGPMDRGKLKAAFEQLSKTTGERIRSLYRSKDSTGRACDVLYFFWVMQVPCVHCQKSVDLFPSWIIAGNAYPKRNPTIRILCPCCGEIFPGRYGRESASCPSCGVKFNPAEGITRGAQATCSSCHRTFNILDAVELLRSRPGFRLYGKLVLTGDGRKEYLRATDEDHDAYRKCTAGLYRETVQGKVVLPTLGLADGFNTRQALRYRFEKWRDFFNDRQLLALGWLYQAVGEIHDSPSRRALSTLLSGTMEFNNLFASYKGEGTGAVRHMFAHHILKPERTPIEANVWGTPKSSGSFSSLFQARLMRALEYRMRPTEVNGISGAGRVCAPAFAGRVEEAWPSNGHFSDRAIYLSCGDSANTGLPSGSIDFIVTDPPFFDNVHYSELADFFYAWEQLASSGPHDLTTRSKAEVQDTDADSFADKLKRVFKECGRVLKDSGLLVFTYHHSRDEGWNALADSILGAGFAVINSHPVKAEMSVAMPKTQAKEPIQLDIVLVCRKTSSLLRPVPSAEVARETARKKMDRLHAAGFTLSRNDQKVILFGQLLTTLRCSNEATGFTEAENTFIPITYAETARSPQRVFQFHKSSDNSGSEEVMR
jgi:putative DNA methylase